MDQRQIMQRNLAQIFKTNMSHYQSLQGNSFEYEPANPFEKRIFEKRMRRSSVHSQSLHPISGNYIFKTRQHQMNYHFEQVSQIMDSTKQQLKMVQERVRQDLRQVFKSEGNQVAAYQKAQKIVESLRFNMEGIVDYAKNNCGINVNQMSRMYDSLPSGRAQPDNQQKFKSIQNNLQTHKFNDENNPKVMNQINKNDENKNPCSYFKNHTKSFYQDFPEPEEESEVYRTKKRSKSTKGSRILHNEKTSMQDEFKGSKKSIYEMVLQERKNKCAKKKKMI